MGLRGVISSVCLILITGTAAFSQMKLVPRERLMAVAQPRLASDSSSFAFDARTVVSDQMNEDDAPHLFSFRFVNAGNHRLDISRVTTTCACMTVRSYPESVIPGSSASIEVVYDPKGHPGSFERKVFVYTAGNDLPSAVLKVSAHVHAGKDLSGTYPVQKGNIRMRRDQVEFQKGVKAVEKIRFVNLSGKPLRLQYEEMFLPESMGFETRPAVLQDGQEGEMVITYSPKGEGDEKDASLILKGLGVPPSKSTIRIRINK